MNTAFTEATSFTHPMVDDAGQFGGDDGLGGYMPLAVAVPDSAAPGATLLAWVHANHMGVPIRYSDAAGNTLSAPTGYSVPGFPGQSQTSGLGGADLYYNRYRDYDSSTGQYIQADPIGLAGGANSYLYAEGNPARYVDPMGLDIYNLFPYAEPGLQEAANRTYNNLPQNRQDGFNHIFGHASKNVFCINAKAGVNCLIPEQFEHWLVDNHVNRNKPIMLWGVRRDKATIALQRGCLND